VPPPASKRALPTTINQTGGLSRVSGTLKACHRHHDERHRHPRPCPISAALNRRGSACLLDFVRCGRALGVGLQRRAGDGRSSLRRVSVQCRHRDGGHERDGAESAQERVPACRRSVVLLVLFADRVSGRSTLGEVDERRVLRVAAIRRRAGGWPLGDAAHGAQVGCGRRLWIELVVPQAAGRVVVEDVAHDQPPWPHESTKSHRCGDSPSCRSRPTGLGTESTRRAMSPSRCSTPSWAVLGRRAHACSRFPTTITSRSPARRRSRISRAWCHSHRSAHVAATRQMTRPRGARGHLECGCEC
jgi:hypothetical protein